MQSNSYFPKKPDWGAIAFVLLMLLLLILSMVGCTTQRTATKYFDNHGFQGAAYCASRYPVEYFYRPGTKVRDTTIKYVEGKQIPCPLPALNNLPANFERPTVKCPAEKIVTITQKIRDTIGMIDKAKYKALQGELAKKTEKVGELTAKLEKTEKGRNTWRWIGILFGAMFIIENGVVIGVKMKLI